MAYGGTGKRPMEYASKSSHSNIIKNENVIEFLKTCITPKTAKDLEKIPFKFTEINKIEENPINTIVTIDGGYTEVPIKDSFPSSKITFFQFGSLMFTMEDLEKISHEPFIDPEDIAKLKKIKRLEFVLPSKNVILKDTDTLTSSVRKALYEFFMRKIEENTLMESLKWFIYEEYEKESSSKKSSKLP